MSAFADTSFVFGIYFPRDGSARAADYLQDAPAPVRISTIVRYEFLQAVWFEVWRRENGDARGITQIQAQSALATFDLDLDQGIWELGAPDRRSILTRAENLTIQHTVRHDARSIDLLHIATALESGSGEFLTFDVIQSRVAEIEGFTLLPR